MTKEIEIKNENEELIVLFLEFMKSDDGSYSTEFKKDIIIKNKINSFLKNLISKGANEQEAYKFRDKIFKDIPEESYFIIIPFNEKLKYQTEFKNCIDELIVNVSLRNKGIAEENISEVIENEKLKTKEYRIDEIINIYDISIKPLTGKKEYIGESNKKLRVCRFCGLNEGEISLLGKKITFEKIAHAISEGLGNKLIVLTEECDECNKKFGAKEKNLIDFLDFFRVYYGTKGKKGKVKISYKDLIVERIEKSKLGALDKITEKANQNEYVTVITSPLENCNDFISEREIELPNRFIPLEIYKTLIKYFLSVKETINKEDKELIEWINDEKNYKTVPNTLVFFNNEILEQPKMAIYRIKDNEVKDNYPKCVCELKVINLIFVYFLPNEVINYESFRELFKIYSKIPFYKMYNFSSLNEHNLIINFETDK